jgi:S-adenosylmethionine hydrolase
LRKNELKERESLYIQGQKISYASVFCDTEPGQAFWYYNSSGFVEIAINQGNAAHILDLKPGSPLKRD